MFSIQLLFFFLICFVCGRDNTTKTEKQTNYSNSKHSQGEKILLYLLEFFHKRDINTMDLWFSYAY
ncbi:hypothetical protein AAZX31_18G103100 [Glycine max]